MSRLDDEAERAQRRLFGIDEAAHRDLLAAYHTVQHRLDHDLEQLAGLIEQAERDGRTISVSWLHRQARYRTLLAQLEQRLDQFGETAVGVATSTQGKLVKQAPGDALDLTLAGLGPAPAAAQASIGTVFDTLPAEALDAMIGQTAKGTPLSDLFTSIAPDAVQDIRGTLTSGVAQGRPVRTIAREVRERAEIPALRAMTITRTESLRAYRAASLTTFKDSGMVKEWVWHATRSERTCPVCLAMHGTRHPLDEQLASHPNCRCVQMPVTLSWDELGFSGIPDQRPTVQTGPELFEQMSHADRLAVMGDRRLAAYEAGDIALQDLVRPTKSATWGPGLRQATLTELGI